VLFVIQPQSVRISVDGSPARGFVDYHGDTLTVGRHRIVITPDDDTSPHEAYEGMFVVAVGDGPFRLERTFAVQRRPP